MRRWELSVALDPEREQPLFLQLANSVADDIRSGRLKAGDTLPGSRELAELLGVNRNTIVAGYGELAAEGLIGTRVGGGTFVLPKTPQVSSLAPTPATLETPTFTLARPLSMPVQRRPVPPGTLTLALSMPDARLFPAQSLARAFHRAIGQRGRDLIAYADLCGHLRLRSELATMLTRSRGLAVTPDNLMITRSIEQAIDLVARTLLAPGDVVAVEAFGYPPAWNVLKLAGARLVPLPLDAEGLDVDALETLLSRESVRAVFLTPHHQFPTTAVMSRSRRSRLADLALQHRFAIIEDDYDHEFHYSGKPVLPIAAGSGRANVVYVGSLANLLAPGLSTAFIAAPPAVFERLRSLRAASDARSDVAMECAIAELFADGELLRHTRRMRRTFAARRDTLAAMLTRHLGSALAFRVPDGGMALWARVDDSIDLPGWERAGEREGVFFHNAQPYDFAQREQPFMRLAFSCLDETELGEAVRRMARALTRARTSQLTAIARAPARRTAYKDPGDLVSDTKPRRLAGERSRRS
ncbi:MAG TPA: PLP-dependent aminotransferase family protein [Rudaea sp.]|nr:PLP-dependent aminotransferase family protein [Rudaea sp.]